MKDIELPRGVFPIIPLHARNIDIAKRAIISLCRTVNHVHGGFRTDIRGQVRPRTAQIRPQPARTDAENGETSGLEVVGILDGEHVEGGL